MKRLLASLLLLACGIAFAATAVVTESLVSVRADTLAGKAQAYYQRKAVVDGVTYIDHLPVITWDLGSVKTVTVNGKTYTYAEVMPAVQAIAAQEKAAQ